MPGKGRLRCPSKLPGSRQKNAHQGATVVNQRFVLRCVAEADLVSGLKERFRRRSQKRAADSAISMASGVSEDLAAFSIIAVAQK